MTNDSTAPQILPAPFAILLVSGVDAREFLQGQLSCNMQELSPTRALLSSCNSPQGRVQAVLTTIERSDGIALLVPATMLSILQTRLRKYVLRSKVVLTDTQDRLRIIAATAEQITRLGFPTLESPSTHLEIAGHSILRWHDRTVERYLLIADSSFDFQTSEQNSGTWELADIQAGLPQVYPETFEAFTAQMLNIDLLGGISFEKGCYTGQEIIARTHYRGTVKRRTLRFASTGTPPSPGTRLLSNEEHAGDVIAAAATNKGCELLAVVTLSHADAAIHVERQPAQQLQRLPLPYSLDRQ